MLKKVSNDDRSFEQKLEFFFQNRFEDLVAMSTRAQNKLETPESAAASLTTALLTTGATATRVIITITIGRLVKSSNKKVLNLTRELESF